MLWCCWLGGRKGIRPVKTKWWGAGVVICLERGADLQMFQLKPLRPHCLFSKIQIGLPFWYWLTRVVPEKGPLNGCVCVFLLTITANDKLLRILTGSLFHIEKGAAKLKPQLPIMVETAASKKNNTRVSNMMLVGQVNDMPSHQRVKFPTV